MQPHFVDTFHMQSANKACLYYDELLSIAHAINWGKDYEDPRICAKALKSVRFLGCSGEVTLQEGTNDRSPIRFQILNAFSFEDGFIKWWEWGCSTSPETLHGRITPLLYLPIPAKPDRLSVDIVTFRPGLALAYSVLLSGP